MNNKGADQTARMRSLICAFVVHIWQKQVFSCRGSIDASDMKFCGLIRVVDQQVKRSGYFTNITIKIIFMVFANIN